MEGTEISEVSVKTEKVEIICSESSCFKCVYEQCSQCSHSIIATTNDVADLVKSETDTKTENIGCLPYKEIPLKSEKVELDSDICSEYICQECFANFVTEQLFLNHIRQNHIRVSSTNIKKTLNFSSTIQCDNINSDSLNLNQPLNIDNAVEMLQKGPISNRAHTELRNGSEKTESEIGNNWNCPRCKKHYKNEVEFLNHTKQHWSESWGSVELSQLCSVTNSSKKSIDKSSQIVQISDSQNSEIRTNIRFKRVYQFKRKKPIIVEKYKCQKVDDLKSPVNCVYDPMANDENCENMIERENYGDKVRGTSMIPVSPYTLQLQENDCTVFASEDLIISDEKARINQLREERKKMQQNRKNIKANEARKKKLKIKERNKLKNVENIELNETGKKKQKIVDNKNLEKVQIIEPDKGGQKKQKSETRKKLKKVERIELNETGQKNQKMKDNNKLKKVNISYLKDIQDIPNVGDHDGAKVITNQNSTRESIQNECLALAADCNSLDSNISLQQEPNFRQQEYPCTNCPYVSTNQFLFACHLELHKKTLYHCQVCNYFYRSEEHLGNHMKEEHCGFKTLYKCRLCSYTISGPKSAIKKHYESCPCRDDMFPCDFCTFKCDSQDKIEKHMVTCERSNNVKISKPYKCKECSIRVVSESAMRRHTVKVHLPFRDKKFKCDLCPYKADREDSYKRHYLQHTRRAQKLIVKLSQINK